MWNMFENFPFSEYWNRLKMVEYNFQEKLPWKFQHQRKHTKYQRMRAVWFFGILFLSFPVLSAGIILREKNSLKFSHELKNDSLHFSLSARGQDVNQLGLAVSSKVRQDFHVCQ